MLTRPRRNRKSESIRALVRENMVTADDLVMPLFLVAGKKINENITSLPVANRQSLDVILKEIGQCLKLGIHSFIMFPKIPDELKDKTATYSFNPKNFYLLAAQKIKKKYPDITLISDVALDPYNTDGHDGIVEDNEIKNDETLAVLEKMAVAQAKAGFDVIGPSDMMDGRVEAIRDALDLDGFPNTSIMSYTAKYASAFYGPFRDALDSAPVNDPSIPKDKKTYQMDPANANEALLEAELDTLEGADFLMVKPAINYLDIISLLKDNHSLPIAAYHVSGECAMLIAACQNGWLDYKKAMPESLLSIKRAGADVIISYFAKDFMKLKLNQKVSL
ncbi:MAG: porphobilinogen synthase [Saprospiraceae bacterium]|nr:porphobilinogen synthase [Bacteroidia bacterium]NNE13600.1 porphobilinogen synthase [Saprospiraceae bacterium]NNL92917.1 porphobilinogen synthase [Saprospiraceae bacterium]